MGNKMEITMQDIYVAYRKFKSYVYYDTSNLLMRQQLAKFECENFGDCKDVEGFKSKFREVFDPMLEINKDSSSSSFDSSSFFKEKLEEVNYWLIPKKIKVAERWNKDEHFITNSIPTGKFNISEYNILINAPIEIHVLSVLWIMTVGMKLNKYICKDNYAYKLSLYQHDSGKTINGDDSKNKHIDKGLRLFEPYYTGYQQWRDRALDKALSGLDENKDVTILSLDVRRYYYSVKLNVEKDLDVLLSDKDTISCKDKKLNKEDEIEIEEDKFIGLEKKLNSLLQSVHKKYAERIKGLQKSQTHSSDEDEKYPLPVGLLSSGVLANLYLKDFDEYVNDTITPAYYGRYVDDILMVFIGKKIRFPENVKDPENISPIDDFIKKHIVREATDETLSTVDSDDKNVSEANKDKKFNEKKYKVGHVYRRELTYIKSESSESGHSQGNDKEILYIIKAPNSDLEIQQKKVIMEYFKPHESRAAINNFRKRLQQNSSEYRLLPFEYNIDKEFDEEAFKLELNDSDSKIRSLQGVNEDKYGASKYLAHKIFLSTLPFDPDEKDKKYRKSSADQILTYFRGHNSLCIYTLWEKVSTYFLVNDEMVNLWKFYTQQKEAIEKIEYKPDSDSDGKLSNQDVQRKLKDNLIKILLYGMGMAFALDPSKIMSFKHELYVEDNGDDNKLGLKELAARFRKSYMFRHQYQYLRGLCFTKENLDDDSSILGKDVLNKKIGKFHKDGVARCLSPVFLRLENIAMVKYYNRLGTMLNTCDKRN